MATGGHNGQGNRGELEQVSQAFASRIVQKARRLADYLQGRLAHHLAFARKPFLPLWLPDSRAFATARWAESLMSRVYDTIQSLPGVRQVGSAAPVEPTPFVWFRPNRPWPGMPQGNEGAETEPWPLFETTLLRADSAESHQHPAPGMDGHGHVFSSPFSEATPRPHQTTKPASLFAQRQKPPIASLRRMGLRLGLAAGPDDLRQGPGLPITYPGLVDRGESIHPTFENAAGPRFHGASGGRGEPTMTRRYEESGQSILPHVLARALPSGGIFDTVPRVKKVIAFVHRLLTASAAPPTSQGSVPLTVPTTATVHPSVAMEDAASTLVEWAGPELTQQRAEPLLPESVSATDTAPGRPSPIGDRRQFAAWLHRRRHRASTGLSLEQRYLPTEAAERGGLLGALHAGSPADAASMAPPSPEFVFPAPPAMAPASPADLAVLALQPPASHDLVLPQHRPPPQQRARVSASPSQMVPIMAGLGAGALPPTTGPSHGGIAGPGFALAPLERPQSPRGQSGAAPGTAAREPATPEETQEAAEENLERLARDVYAVLRRRLAWERERNMVLTS